MSDEITFLEKTEDEIKKEIYKIAQEETGIRNYKSIGVLRGFIEVIVKVIFTLYSNALNNIYNRADLDRAIGFWLSLWGLLLGVNRKQAKRTTGILTIKAYSTGTLEKGTYVRVDGTTLRFKVKETVQFLTGTFSAKIEAEFSGRLYNIPSGTPLSFKKVVYGIEETNLGTDWIIVQGDEEEKDKPYRTRIKAKWLSIGDGNPPKKFELIASSVEGVKETKIIRTPRGQGTTDLYISSVSGEKLDSIKIAVEEAIDSVGLVCRDLLVKWPTDLKRNYHIQFSGSYTKEEIAASLRNYILSIPMGGILEERKIYTHLESLYPYINRLEVIEPARDISASGTLEKVERILPPLPNDPDGFYLKVDKI